MKKYIKNIVPVAALLLTMGTTTSCVGDLDVTPINPNIQTNLNIDGLFNKCYANFAMAGNGGASGDCDIDGIDGGTSGFVRQTFNANELTTDEAICGWGDDGIAGFCYNNYNATNPMLTGLYARITTGIAYCNQYLAEAGDQDATKLAEVRFLRAYEYYSLMDAWGNIPFTLQPLTKPERYTRAQTYEWLEKELLEIEPNLSEAKAKKSTDAGYGRVDKAACWLLLSRLYLNAEVYTGTAQWAKAKEQENSPMLYYIRQKAGTTKVMDIDALAEDIQTNCALTTGDVKHTIEALVEQLRKVLTQGNKVKIEGLGTFHMTLTCLPGETEKECTVKNIKRVNVRFIPDKAMKLVNASRSMTRSPNNVTFAMASAGAPEGGGSGDGGIVDDPTA